MNVLRFSAFTYKVLNTTQSSQLYMYDLFNPPATLIWCVPWPAW